MLDIKRSFHPGNVLESSYVLVMHLEGASQCWQTKQAMIPAAKLEPEEHETMATQQELGRRLKNPFGMRSGPSQVSS